MIECQNISCGYGKNAVLRELSARFENGKLTVIIGPNGCGKSTLLKAMMGFLPCDAGKITVDDAVLSELRQIDIAKRIGYLSQSRSIPDMTAEQLVLHGRFAHLSYPRIYKESDRAIARDAMRAMGVDAYAGRRLSALSGGMRQNVYLAMLLCGQTDHLLMDEPATYLDIAASLSMMEQARALADSGKAVVMVLHDIPMALRFADTVYVMEHGRVVSCGTPHKVYASGIIERVFGVSLRYDDRNDRYYF